MSEMRVPSPSPTIPGYNRRAAEQLIRDRLEPGDADRIADEYIGGLTAALGGAERRASSGPVSGASLGGAP